MPEFFSSDGKTLVFRAGLTRNNIQSLPVVGERKPRILYDDTSTKDQVQLSPDGKRVSFNSDESGRVEVYIASFPSFSDRRQVSKAGGGQATWRKDGRELFYLSPGGELMSVEIMPGAALVTGTPRMLFQTTIEVVLVVDQYAPTADGQSFLVVEPVESATAQRTPITVVLDWPAALPSGK